MIYRQNFKFYQKKRVFARNAGLVMAVVFVLLGQISAAKAQDVLAMSAVPETVFPAGELVSADGQGFSFAAYEGRSALLVNFWASWCAPCVAELPELAEAAHLLADDGIKVVLISVDRKGQDHAMAFLEERGIDSGEAISAFNPASDWPRELGLRGLPSSYLISRDGADIYLIQGPEAWADKAVLDEVRALIGR